MKFTCKTSDLFQALQFVIRAVSTQHALPILQNILLETEENRCKLSATNLELSIISTFPVATKAHGGITVPAKALLNVVQYGSEEEMLFEVLGEGKLRCSSSRTKILLCGESVENYPKISILKEREEIFFEPMSLLEGLHLTTFSAAQSSLRPVLSGVYIKSTEKGLIIAATDSYRLSEYILPISTEGQQVECIIPVKVLEELKGIVSSVQKAGKSASKGNLSCEVSMALNSQQIQFTVGSTHVLSRLINGIFPNYQQIIPSEKKTKALVSVQKLITTIKRMHYFAKEVNNTLTFVFSSCSIHISTPQTQLGNEESTPSSETERQQN